MLQFHVKRVLSLFLAAFLALTVSPVVYATDVSAQNAQDTIREYIEALDNNDWGKIITLSPDCDYQENISFYYSKENAENGVGFHTITSAKLVTAIELDNQDLLDYTNANDYFDTYNALKLYLVGVDMLATMVTPPKKGGRSPYAAAHTQATMGGNRTDEALLELSTLVLANCQPALPLRRSICAG